MSDHLEHDSRPAGRMRRRWISFGVATLAVAGLGLAGAQQASAFAGHECVFNAPKGAPSGIYNVYYGHVGWGYYTGASAGGKEVWTYGATEGGAAADKWHETGSYNDMIAAFTNGTHRSKGKGYYTTMKCGGGSGDVSAARAQTKVVEASKYKWNGNNCMNNTHSILTKYGANGLPSPSKSVDNYAPNNWYGKIKWTKTTL